MPDVPVVVKTVSSQLATTQKDDFYPVLTLDYEDAFPLTTFTGRTPQKVLKNSIFKFPVGRRIPRATTAAAAVPQGPPGVEATISLPAGAGRYFSIGDKIWVPSGTDTATHSTKLIVKSASANAIVVFANDPAKGVAAIASGAALYRYSMGIMEGSSGRPAIATVPTVYTQFCPTFEDYGQTNLQVADTEMWTIESEVVRVRKEKRIEHLQNIEGSYFFDEKSLDTTHLGTPSNPRYTPDGLFKMITTNKYAYGAAMTTDGLYAFMAAINKPMFSLGQERLVFASQGLMTQFNKLFSSAIRVNLTEGTSMQVGEQSWKVNFTQATFAGMTFTFINTPTISDSYDGAGVVLSKRQVIRRFLRPTTYKPNVANNKDNFIECGWISACALQLMLEEGAGVIVP